MSMRFQFTHPCGCDFLIRQFSKCVQEFQFTHPCGCDVLLTARSTLRMKFQFTHPCGCDQSPERAVARTRGFNSRTRVGATYFPVCPVDDQPVSIHAPVWVRLFALCLDMISMMFQFTHPCGCDLRTLPSPPPGKRFQFTHPCGCDGYRGKWNAKKNRFNSRTRVGATFYMNLERAFFVFQFTHPCGCDKSTIRARPND